jgi:polyvinyl alcohol dehydrogenase (cytochrome)
MLRRIVVGLPAIAMLYTSAVRAQPPVPAQAPPAAAEQQDAAQRPTSTADQVMGFERRCAICHDNPGPESRAPGREALRQLTPERVLAALTTGSMASQATGMNDDQKRAMAELVTGKPFGDAAPRTAASMKNRCDAPLALQNPWTQARWNGWSPDPTTGWRFQPAEAAGFTAEQVPQLKLKWAFAMPGAASAAWAQPTVVGGALFIGSDNGFVYALDARSGCVHWSFEAKGQVRSAIVIGDVPATPGVRYAAFFGDYRGYVYAVNAETGTELWSLRVDEHEGAKITGAPVVDPAGGRLYVPVTSWEEIPAPDLTYKCCTFQGSVVALDVKNGKQIWKTYTMPERPMALKKNSAGTQLYGPAGGGVWNPPTIDLKNRTLYVGTGNTYIVSPNGDADDAIMAFDLATGRRLWWTHMGPPDPHPGGCGTGEARRINCPGYVNGRDDDASGAPVLHTLANGRRILIEGQESGRVTAVDPDSRGKVLWVAQAGDELAASNNGFGGAFDGELYFKPLPFADHSGAVAAIKATTGERVWYTKLPKPDNCADPTSRQTCHSGIWAGATAIRGAVFAGSRDGILRAFSASDGRIIWEYATHREFPTVNGVPGNGGGFGGPGPAIAGGMLYIGSGYAILTGSPGNVLLAFGVE